MGAETCCICGLPNEAWPGGSRGSRGYGHNPAPWPVTDIEHQRCCNWCNEHIVIPLRIRMALADREGRVMTQRE